MLNWHIEKDTRKDGLSINSYIEKTQDPNLALIVQWHEKEITNTTCWKQDTRPQKHVFQWIHTLKTQRPQLGFDYSTTKKQGI